MEFKPWHFLAGVAALYVVLAPFLWWDIVEALRTSLHIIVRVLPALLVVFLLMWLVNAFVTPKRLTKHLGRSAGVKGWLIAIVGGIISAGPLYLWYPLLNDLQRHGVRNAYLATFLYNRAVKLPLLPVLIVYFGLSYTLLLFLLMVLLSIPVGWITEVNA